MWLHHSPRYLVVQDRFVVQLFKVLITVRATT